MIGYLFLGAAILLEIFSTSMLKLSMGFTKLIPSVVFVVGMSSSFYVLSKALNLIPLSIAYAIWSGIGTALTALIGVYIWKEELSMTAVIGIALIVIGVILLNLKGAAIIGHDSKVYNIIPCIRGEVGSFYFTKKESHLNLKVH